MPLNVTRYELDVTGINPDNLVEDEVHQITLGTTNLIVPEFGYFFKESLVIKDTVTGDPLVSGQYICTEFSLKHTLRTGKEIVGSILITDDSIINPVSITYQVLGGENTRSPTNVLAVWEDRLQPNLAINIDDLLNVPDQFPPKPGHFHNFIEIHDWIRIFKYLDGIAQAIVVGKKPAYDSLREYIDRIVAYIDAYNHSGLDIKLVDIYHDFIAQFTKQYFGLDNVTNLAIASNEEARRAANIYFEQGDIGINKYMALAPLVTFKEGLYDGIVNKLTTNLGVRGQKYVLPLKSNLLDMENGANITFVSKDVAAENNVPFDNSVYPKDLNSNPITVYKTNNGVGHRGGLHHASNDTENGYFFGRHTNGEVNTNFNWKQYLIDGIVGDVRSIAIKHIQDTGNPHQVDKRDILLDKVENLNVVTRDNILNMTSAREYLTMDTLLYFMRAFLQQNGWHVELPEDHKNRFLLDNCQVVFSPCGSCGCNDRSDFQPSPTPEPTPPPTTPPPSTCHKGVVVLRNGESLLMGYYPDDPNRDPEATVPLYYGYRAVDGEGNPNPILCYIYPPNYKGPDNNWEDYGDGSGVDGYYYSYNVYSRSWDSDLGIIVTGDVIGRAIVLVPVASDDSKYGRMRYNALGNVTADALVDNPLDTGADEWREINLWTCPDNLDTTESDNTGYPYIEFRVYNDAGDEYTDDVIGFHGKRSVVTVDGENYYAVRYQE